MQMRKLGRRGAWGLADQAASSLTNFVMSFIVLRSVSIAAFGVFTIAYTTYTFAVGLARGAIAEPLVVSYSAAGRDRWREGAAGATGAGLALSALAAVAVAGAGWIVGGELATALVALAVVLPGLILQDMWRFAFFAAATPAKAFVNDTVWGDRKSVV